MKIIEKHPTAGVRETIREAHRLIRLLGYAFAEWQTSHDLGSWEEFTHAVDAASEFGVSDADMTREIVKAVR